MLSGLNLDITHPTRGLASRSRLVGWHKKRQRAGPGKKEEGYQLPPLYVLARV